MFELQNGSAKNHPDFHFQLKCMMFFCYFSIFVLFNGL